MQPEYDFSCGVRAKYAAQFRKIKNVVALDPRRGKAKPRRRAKKGS
jgi:hypothetical protein